MSQPKPNTMDDLELIVSQTILHTSGVIKKWKNPTVHPKELNDELDKIYQKTVAALTAKLEEVDRAARIDGYAQGASDCITDLHNQGAISGLSKAESLKRINQMREDRLASLKGGDDE